MLKNINQCDVYVGMWCIYMLQGVLYPSGIINQLLQLIMLLWCMLVVLKHFTHATEHSSILKATLVLIIMYTIYGVLHILYDEPIKIFAQYFYLQSALNSLTPIFLFYYFTKNGQLTSNRIRIYLPILIVTCIFVYYEYENFILLKTNKEEFTNNIGYMFITLIPFLFFYSKKPILQYVFMAIILLYVFMCMKRGAILIAVVTSIMLIYINIKESSLKTKILFIFLTIIIVVGISQYVNHLMNNSEYFIVRLEQTIEGDASNRDIIYGRLWDTLLLESNPFSFYFGRGANSTIKMYGTLAHQDWLEIFCNNGLIGVVILFFFFYTFGKNVWKSRNIFSEIMFYSFATLFVIIFSKTLFSMSIQDLKLSESMLLGYFAYWVVPQPDNIEFSNYDEEDE